MVNTQSQTSQPWTWMSAIRSHHVVEGSAILIACILGLMVARVPLVYVVLAVGGIAVCVGTLFEPLIGLAGALVLAPFEAWLSAWYPHLPSSGGQLMLFLAIGSWVVRLVISGRWKTLKIPPLLGALGVFMVAQLVSLWQPVDVWVGFLEFAKWGQVLVVMLLVWERTQDERLSQHRVVLGVLAALALAALVQVGMGFWQFALWDGVPESFAINERFFRASGSFEQPNPYAGFMGLIAPVFVGMAIAMAFDWLHSCWQKHKFDWPSLTLALTGVLAAVFSGGIIMSWSRGGWMAFGGALLVMAGLLPRKIWLAVLVLAALLIVGYGAYEVGLIPASITDRLTGFLEYMSFSDQRGVSINDENYSFVERMSHWQSAIWMWQDNFWLGVGFGNYEPAYEDYRLISWIYPLGHAHNFYLNVLAEMGVIGFVAYMIFQGTLAVRLFIATQRLHGWQRGLALGLLGSLAYLAVHNMVDFILVNNSHLQYGVLLALSAYVVERSKQAPRRNEAGAMHPGLVPDNIDRL